MSSLLFLSRLEVVMLPRTEIEFLLEIFRDIYLLLVDLVARCTLNIKIENPRDPQNDFASALITLFQGASGGSALLRKIAREPFLKLDSKTDRKRVNL